MADIIVAGNTSGAITISAPLVAGSTVLTLPVIATDTLAGIAATQTLTNKTLGAGTVMPAGSVLQVLSTTKTDTFTSTTANTWVDVTGLSVSITPRSISSKILVSYCCNVCTNPALNGELTQILRDSTPIGVGTTASGNRINAGTSGYTADGNWTICAVQQILDSPSTTSAITYKLQIRVGTGGTGTVHVNQTFTDTDANYSGRLASSITVQEIQG